MSAIFDRYKMQEFTKRPQAKDVSITVFFYDKWFSRRVDSDVYLPSYGVNLQRGEVWTIEQKQEMIRSVMVGRSMQNICLNLRSGVDEDKYQIVDGKQRFTTIRSFMDNKFKVDGFTWGDFTQHDVHHFYSNLNFCLMCNIYHDLTDHELVQLFNFINFAGTPQDNKHRAMLNSLMSNEGSE